MSWIDALDQYGHNFLIDQLVYLIEQTKPVVSVSKSQNPVGYLFRFDDGTTDFVSVLPQFLDEHWIEAIEIVKNFSELSEFTFV